MKNKLLTTITLLCFSVAANADIYICDSSAIGVLGLSNFVSEEAEFQNQYILDTNASTLRRTIYTNVRETEPTIYNMQCVEGRNSAIACEINMEPSYGRFLINPYSLNYSYVVSNVYLPSAAQVIVSAGTCSKA